MNDTRGVTKVQHFVPQFLLRYFSYNMNKKTIGMFNVNNEILKVSVPIKTQSYEDFFYGKSGEIENWLKELETKYAPIFRDMWEFEKLPDFETEQHLHLLHFLIIMDLRNPIRINNNKKLEGIVKNTISLITNKPVDSSVVNVFKGLGTEDTMKEILINAVTIVPMCIDLKFKLIKNTSKSHFIMSDNPLIIYNQFLEKRKWDVVSHRGYGIIGLQMFLPLNDTYMLIVYDPRIYKVGNNKEKIVEIDDYKSVDQLNILQFLNSTDTVYFNHNTSDHYIKRLFEKSKSFKKANEPFIKVHRLYDDRGNIKPLEEAYEAGVNDLKANLIIQKINFSSNSVAVKVDGNFAQYRPNVEINEADFKRGIRH